MAYTYKIVNGVKVACNAADQTALAARDAEGRTNVIPPAVATTSTKERVAAVVKAFGLTLAEFKDELAKP
jgi:hypothetical protein